jgi:predicted RNA-binding protein
MNYWLVVGAKQNWVTAFEHGNIWGLRKTQQHLWDSISENDKVLFYATQPVGGIIGHGIIRTKFRQDKPLWPEEVRRHEVIWPLRFEFDVELCLPQEVWKTKKLVSKSMWPRAGFQLLSEGIAEELISAIGTTEYVIPSDEKLLIAEETIEYETGSEEKEKLIPSHEAIKEQLIKIGKLQNFIVEEEYPFDIGKLDVVWRRVMNSVPTYVFEVQVGGDVYHALAKLKHAFDLWNSHIFIIAPEKDLDKANNLLAGTFHEINNRIKLIELNDVGELYKRKKAYFDLESALGI